MPGRELDGHSFRDGVPDAAEPPVRGRRGRAGRRCITAEGKHVVIIGGGDTGADCLGTVHRQGATSVHQFELLPRPPADARAETIPWPEWPNIFRVVLGARGGRRASVLGLDQRSSAMPTAASRAAAGGAGGEIQREGGRMRVQAACPAASSRWRPISCCWRWGSWGRSERDCCRDLGVRLTDRGNVWRDEHWMTSVPGVFAAGDMQRGQSLIVWAIADGRSAARGVDAYLMGELGAAAPAASARPGLATRPISSWHSACTRTKDRQDRPPGRSSLDLTDKYAGDIPRSPLLSCKPQTVRLAHPRGTDVGRARRGHPASGTDHERRSSRHRRPPELSAIRRKCLPSAVPRARWRRSQA